MKSIIKSAVCIFSAAAAVALLVACNAITDESSDAVSDKAEPAGIISGEQIAVSAESVTEELTEEERIHKAIDEITACIPDTGDLFTGDYKYSSDSDMADPALVKTQIDALRKMVEIVDKYKLSDCLGSMPRDGITKLAEDYEKEEKLRLAGESLSEIDRYNYGCTISDTQYVIDSVITVLNYRLGIKTEEMSFDDPPLPDYSKETATVKLYRMPEDGGWIQHHKFAVEIPYSMRCMLEVECGAEFNYGWVIVGSKYMEMETDVKPAENSPTKSMVWFNFNIDVNINQENRSKTIAEIYSDGDRASIRCFDEDTRELIIDIYSGDDVIETYYYNIDTMLSEKRD